MTDTIDGVRQIFELIAQHPVTAFGMGGFALVGIPLAMGLYLRWEAIRAGVIHAARKRAETQTTPAVVEASASGSAASINRPSSAGEILYFDSRESALQWVREGTPETSRVWIMAINGGSSMGHFITAVEGRIGKKVDVRCLLYNSDVAKITYPDDREPDNVYLCSLRDAVKKNPSTAKAACEYLFHASQVMKYDHEPHRDVVIATQNQLRGFGTLIKASPGVPGKPIDPLYVDSRSQTEGGMLAA
ncbi:MAG: hypothetical protein HY985_03005 [Magnetospirillum sp.]|nr:hypothetical protein [Magnetospirillum sp.]